jgi:hypothetical protein
MAWRWNHDLQKPFHLSEKWKEKKWMGGAPTKIFPPIRQNLWV